VKTFATSSALAAAAVLTLAFPLGALGQTKLPTVGLLWNDSVRPSRIEVILLTALGEKGYSVDRNLRIENRISLEGYRPMMDGAAHLARSKVDVIVSFGTTATLAAAKATKEIPIVMIAGLDPVEAGLATSMSRPGGNVTGVTLFSGDLIAKRVQLLKEVLPSLKRLGILYNADSATSMWRRDLEAIARDMQLQTQIAEVRTADQLEGAFARLAASRIDGFIVIPSSFLTANAERVVELAKRHNTPGVYNSWRYLEAGGLMTYQADVSAAVARAAVYVDRILKGSSPRDMPIEQPTKIEFGVNLKAAKELGVTIPPAILLRADRVIE
jgi:putative ABC transport system substrate-binding protein